MQKPTQSAVNSFFKKKTPAPTMPIVVSEVDSQATTPPPPPPACAKRCGKYDSLEKRSFGLRPFVNQ